MMAVAKEEEGKDPEDDIPGWVRPMILPLKAMVSAVTVEYGFHEARFWLPRSQAIEGDANVSFMRILQARAALQLRQRQRHRPVSGSDYCGGRHRD